MPPMRITLLLAACLAAPALAQTQPAPPDTATGARPGNEIGTGMSLPRSNQASNLNAATTHSELAPNLPAPNGPEDVRSLLLDARGALAGGRTGEAQEALERAESRALTRDIPVGAERVPAAGPLVGGINQARDALAAGNTRGAIGIIDGVLSRM